MYQGNDDMLPHGWQWDLCSYMWRGSCYGAGWEESGPEVSEMSKIGVCISMKHWLAAVCNAQVHP